MITATLYRQKLGNHGTFGILIVPDLQWCCVTLEREWKYNIQFVSCIPPGEYICELTESKKFDKITYEIKNVPGRYGIRFHPANWDNELYGCIALGRFIRWSSKGKMITNSRKTLDKFEDLFNGGPFKLVIKNANHTTSNNKKRTIRERDSRQHLFFG